MGPGLWFQRGDGAPQLAFLSLHAVVLNLNPLLELDGYFILMDSLDRPNLRPAGPVVSSARTSSL